VKWREIGTLRQRDTDTEKEVDM
jgi:hypothetical protein